MVFVLVVLTVVIFLAADLIRVRHQRKVQDAKLAAGTAGVFVHPGHTWVRFGGTEGVLVGTSDFAVNLAGAVRAIELPDPGTSLRQGQAAWTLVSSRNRRLTQVMPVDGKVVAVNPDLHADPVLVQRDPLESGWILRIEPRRVREGLRNLFRGDLADLWAEATRMKMNMRLQPALGRLANDGGEWVPGFGDLLEEGEWNEVLEATFPVGAPWAQDRSRVEEGPQ